MVKIKKIKKVWHSCRAVLWGVQRAQQSWASQNDGPQEKNYCSIFPPPLKKEK